MVSVTVLIEFSLAVITTGDYALQKEVVMDFMKLRESGLIPWYITTEDLKAWIIARDQNVIKERCEKLQPSTDCNTVYHQGFLNAFHSVGFENSPV